MAAYLIEFYDSVQISIHYMESQNFFKAVHVHCDHTKDNAWDLILHSWIVAHNPVLTTTW